MFRPGRRRGGGGGGFVVLLLTMHFFSCFPVTLGVLGLNLVTYLRPKGVRIHWPFIRKACISIQRVWFEGEWIRLFTSPVIHSSDYHLAYNMISFMWKAVTLERHFGSGYFAYMFAVFSVATGIVGLMLDYFLMWMFDVGRCFVIPSCSVGFSAVIFALKVITTHIQPAGMTMVMGVCPIPTRLACWAELVIVSVLFPNAFFISHLAGILVGLGYVWGPLKMVMDMPVSMLNAINGTPPLLSSSSSPPGQSLSAEKLPDSGHEREVLMLHQHSTDKAHQLQELFTWREQENQKRGMT
jgi:rhomboid domain-containing protein 1